MVKKWKSLKVTEETHSHYKFVADRLGVDLYKFLEELGIQLMDIFGDFKPSGANCFYDARGNQLIVTVYGKSNLANGLAFNDEERKRQIGEKFKLSEDEEK